MKKHGRRPVLDDGKRREILALLSVGCSRRVAAAYVGCSVTTIRATALRDPEFAKALGRVEHQAEIGYLQNIQKAAKKEQYWRAAAWALERKNPEEYALRRPELVTVDQLQNLLAQLAQVLVADVPDPTTQEKILSRLNELTKTIGAGQPKRNKK